MTTVNCSIDLSKLNELRQLIEEVYGPTSDAAIWRPLGRALSIIDVYLTPRVDVNVEVRDDTSEKVAK